MADLGSSGPPRLWALTRGHSPSSCQVVSFFSLKSDSAPPWMVLAVLWCSMAQTLLLPSFIWSCERYRADVRTVWEQCVAIMSEEDGDDDGGCDDYADGRVCKVRFDANGAAGPGGRDPTQVKLLPGRHMLFPPLERVHYLQVPLSRRLSHDETNIFSTPRAPGSFLHKWSSSDDIRDAFRRREPYNYLQRAYYQLKKLDLAAAAAHTFFVANPTHLQMREDMAKYRRMSGVRPQSFRDLETPPYWAAYDTGLELLGRQEAALALPWLEEALQESLAQVESCRAGCEGPEEQQKEEEEEGGTGSQGGLYEAIAGHWIGVVQCRQRCVEDTATRPGRSFPVPDFLPGQLRRLHEAHAQACLSPLREDREKRLWDHEPPQPKPLTHWKDVLLLEGVTLTQDARQLNGSERAVLDGLLTPAECGVLLQLAKDAAESGARSGYPAGRRSPHTPHERFEGLTVLKAAQLARAGAVGSQGAQLLLEVSERVRSLTQAYFSPDRPLHLSFTHLVCRSAIEGEQAQRMDLSHPVHADNCVLDPDTGECWREPPAYTYRDYSGLLYLNDDFQGGDLFFTEPNALTVTAQVRPRCGRLVAFSSGVENPHGVWAVTRGRRCTLALWHTWAPEHREQEWTEAKELLQEPEKEEGEELPSRDPAPEPPSHRLQRVQDKAGKPPRVREEL
ncbi:Prolyl 3-hydroxylase 3, partial [Eschrichtius robustus]|nr:Prolyl 3-hydroxylase 3 [Eschrichtius robustus]